jgi:hypothetical protein
MKKYSMCVGGYWKDVDGTEYPLSLIINFYAQQPDGAQAIHAIREGVTTWLNTNEGKELQAQEGMDFNWMHLYEYIDEYSNIRNHLFKKGITSMVIQVFYHNVIHNENCMKEFGET